MKPCQPTAIYLTPHDLNVGAGLLAKAAWQSTQLDCVHIHCCGNGYLGFRSDSGSLWKRAGMPAQPKVTKGLLPHHSAPRLGSVCPNAGLNPWAAATRHPWRGAANPASCRVTHEFKPAFGQRGLTGRLRSRSKADQDQERLASHRGYRRLPMAIAGKPASTLISMYASGLACVAVRHSNRCCATAITGATSPVD